MPFSEGCSFLVAIQVRLVEFPLTSLQTISTSSKEPPSLIRPSRQFCTSSRTPAHGFHCAYPLVCDGILVLTIARQKQPSELRFLSSPSLRATHYTYAISSTTVALHHLSIPITDAIRIPLSDACRGRCVAGGPTGEVAR